MSVVIRGYIRGYWPLSVKSGDVSDVLKRTFVGPHFKNKKLPESVIRTAFLSLQILTGEDWNAAMYDGIQAYGGVKDLGLVARSFLFHFWLIVFTSYT